MQLYYSDLGIGVEVEIPVGKKILRIDWDHDGIALNYRFMSESSKWVKGNFRNLKKGQLSSIIKAIWSANGIYANWKEE